MTADTPALRPAWLDAWLDGHADDLVAVRRRIHSRPELGYAEHETTALLVARLEAAGLDPRVLPSGTGLLCDVGTGPRMVGLRADIDALPLTDAKLVPYRSTVDGACHVCGHDAHATMLLGAAEALAAAPALPGRVRIVFQPAEETVPGGALEAIDGGALKDVERIFALHCDPRLTTGQVGLRAGSITAACDKVEVHLSGPGGHTARPHLTVDLVNALGKVITEVPGLLARHVDPRAGMSLVWGAVESGVAANAIPRDGVLRGTVRVLSREAWHGAGELVRRLITEVVAPTGAGVTVSTSRACRRWSTTRRRWACCARACWRRWPGRGVGGGAEPGRRGLRLVPRTGPRRPGPPRRAAAARDRPLPRPAPAQLRRRRGLPARRRAPPRRHRPRRPAGLSRPRRALPAVLAAALVVTTTSTARTTNGRRRLRSGGAHCRYDSQRRQKRAGAPCGPEPPGAGSPGLVSGPG